MRLLPDPLPEPVHRAYRLFALALAVAILASTPGCSERLTDTGTIRVSPVEPPPPLNGAFLFQAREIPLGGRLQLEGPLYAGYYEDYGPFTWTIRDPGVAAWQGRDGQSGTIEARTPGTTLLSVTGTQIQASVPITVLDTAPAPNPVVVEDFHIVEVEDALAAYGQADDSNRFVYAPRIVVRDTSRAGASAVIGVWFEIPGEAPTARCAMLRWVTPPKLNLFRDYYGRFEYTLRTRGRLTYAQPVIAHLTIRVPGPAAREVTVAASQVVAGGLPSIVNYLNDDVLTCG